MALSEILVNVVFYVFAAIVAGGALAVAASRNIVRSAFSLLAVLFGVAALYALMKADFIAAAQVLIYVGGILVLIIFAIMLTHRITDVSVSNESTPGPAAFCACLCLLFALVVVILFTGRKWERGPDPFPPRTVLNAEMRLLQYQADGRTGLEWGGNTFEDGAVLEVEVDRPAGETLSAEFELVPEGKDKQGKDKKALPLDENRVPLERKGGLYIARFAVPPILRDPDETPADTKLTWRVRLVGAGIETDWMKRGGKGPDFVVYPGVTKPVAWALMGPYLLAFEVVSVLLLAALVGAAFLARKEVRAP